jgi:uncharacterized protein
MTGMANGPWRDRNLPELLIGLAVIAVAFVVTGFLVADAIKDVKASRDTIRVTGSAKHPIAANLVSWTLSVDAKAAEPEEATRLLRERAQAVRDFLREGGVPDSAIKAPPVSTEETTLPGEGRRRIPAFLLRQRFDIESREIDKLETVSASITDLLAAGVPVSAGELQYISTELNEARIEALKKAIANARDRAETIVEGIGGDLGSVRSAQLGVYQVTPRNSTEVSDYGINDTSSRLKDVTAVVSVTFAVR